MISYLRTEHRLFLSSLVFLLGLNFSSNNVVEGLQFKSANRAEATSLDVRLADESNIPKSRKKRSIIFPTGSDLSFDVGLSIPISALSATGNLKKKCCNVNDTSIYFLLLLNLVRKK